MRDLLEALTGLFTLGKLIAKSTLRFRKSGYEKPDYIELNNLQKELVLLAFTTL